METKTVAKGCSNGEGAIPRSPVQRTCRGRLRSVGRIGSTHPSGWLLGVHPVGDLFHDFEDQYVEITVRLVGGGQSDD